LTHSRPQPAFDEVLAERRHQQNPPPPASLTALPAARLCGAPRRSASASCRSVGNLSSDDLHPADIDRVIKQVIDLTDRGLSG
jgi:hypothetical protein